MVTGQTQYIMTLGNWNGPHCSHCENCPYSQTLSAQGVHKYIVYVCVMYKEELLDGGHKTSEALHFCWVELREYLEMICMVVQVNVSMCFFYAQVFTMQRAMLMILFRTQFKVGPNMIF